VRLLAVALLWVTAAFGQSVRHAPEYSFKIIHQFPHDASAFTQGLAYQDGYFYEGTGLNGKSSLRQVEVQTGTVVKKVDLPAEYFGEGITVFKNEIVQLTWQSHAGFVYNLKDFHQISQFSFAGEGWGLATDGRQLYLSDGTSEIRVLDPGTFAEKRRIKVRDDTTPVTELNELEFVDGQIWANVWMTDRIARISPVTGKVVGWIDLKGLLSPIYSLPPEAVLNGIAYDGPKKRLFVTGKLWPAVFEIRVVTKKR
jgi:glutaminyl-peptide cyclotransferase